MFYKQRVAGVGELVPAQDWVVPFNPFNNSVTRGIGELTPGSYPLPDNPLAPLSNPLVAELAKPNCPNALRAAVLKMQGLGAVDTSSVGSAISSSFSSVTEWAKAQPWTTWALVGGGLVLVVFMSGGGRPGYRAAKREALRKLKQQYPTRASKARRALEAY